MREELSSTLDQATNVKIYRKDLNLFGYNFPEYAADGKILYLKAYNKLSKKDCATSFSVKDDSIKLHIHGDDPNFINNKYNLEKHISDLNKQGSCISFYILPKSKSNFYRFEATTDNRKAIHYYSKLKNKKYKPQKRKMEWNLKFDKYDNLWVFEISIPLSSIKMSSKDLQGSKFLLAKFSYSDCRSMPQVINSMGIPIYQFSNPESWNIISPLKDNNKTINKDHAQLKEIVNIENNRLKAERIINNSETAELYVSRLNQIYELLGWDAPDKTFQMLERFVNIPDNFNMIELINKKLDILIESKNIDHIRDIITVVDGIVEGTQYWSEYEFNEKIKLENKIKSQRLTASQNNQDDSQYFPCFIEIWKKEKTGVTFGRKLALKSIYENCKRKWPIKFGTFRKKYKLWDSTISEDNKIEDIKSIPCELNNKCTCFHKN